MVLPSSLRKEEAYMMIENFSPFHYTLHWIGPSSVPEVVEDINPYQVGGQPRYIIKSTPGHQFLLIRNDEENISHEWNVFGIVDFIYIEQSGELYHSHRN